MSEIVSITGKVKEINDRHELAQSYAKNAIENAIRIGELLSEIKASLKHGQWIPWVDKHLPFNTRQAQNYLRIYSNRAELANTQHVSHLPMREAIELLSTPKDEPQEEQFEEDEIEEYQEETEAQFEEPEKVEVTPVVYEDDFEEDGKDYIEDIFQKAKLFDKWDRAILDIRYEIINSLDHPAMSHIYKPFLESRIKNLRDLLLRAKPLSVCDECRGKSDICEKCESKGFLTKGKLK